MEKYSKITNLHIYILGSSYEKATQIGYSDDSFSADTTVCAELDCQNRRVFQLAPLRKAVGKI